MDFMFWGCFNWFEKGPCHVWEKETKEEKKAASAELKVWNDANEARLKEEWELQNGMRRLNIERTSVDLNRHGNSPLKQVN